MRPTASAPRPGGKRLPSAAIALSLDCEPPGAHHTMFMIRNKASGEVAALVADASHRHPGWVHEQCGTRTEGELQVLLGRLQLADYIRAGKNNEDARGVFVSIPNGAVAWKLADPF